MKKILCAALSAAVITPTLAVAQQSTLPPVPHPSLGQQAPIQKDPTVVRIMAEAERHFQLGEAAYGKGKLADARKEFDRAVDTVLEARIDVRTNTELNAYFINLIEKINALEVEAIAKGESINEQKYESSPLDEIAELELPEETPAASDQKIQTKLDFDFTITPEVLQYLHYFRQTKRGQATMATGLRRAGRYLALARRIFAEEGVPLDIVWLAQAESNWRPHARSWAAAQGIWQFVSWRGNQYGLRQNAWMDERSGIDQPTRAAARYLRFLHDRFLNWELAMAAYNCGEGRVDRAIAACGYADFWYLYRHRLLPRETRNYVPIILAIMLVAKEPEKYGFGQIQPDPPIQYDVVKVDNAIDLRLVAEITNTPYEAIEELNPELKRGVTPPGMAYNLRLPVGTDDQLIAVLNRIPESQRDSWRVMHAKAGDTLAAIADQHQVSVEELAQVNGLEVAALLESGRPLVIPTDAPRAPIRGRISDVSIQLARRSTIRTVITVRPGDTLSRIAARYGLSVRELARLNKLSTKSQLRPGQKLILNVPAGRRQPPTTAPTKPGKSTSSSGRKVTIRVRSGDTLSRIAARYGVSISNLKGWNRLRSDKLTAGQTLTIHR
jgi:membrane-bound lytic murein transglycosylase D